MNIPEVKLGIIAVSRDCFPIALSTQRRKNIVAAYGEGLYECPITVENEKSDSFYAEIERKWNAEDTIEICFDMNARIIRPVGIDGKEETKDFFSLLYGPLVLALDSRLTSVGETIPLDGKISVNAHEKVLPKCLFSADVIIGNKKLLMIDYGSAGKTWDEHSQIEAWIKCK